VIAVTVHGAEGRMGRLAAELVVATPDFRLTALVTEPGRDAPVGALHPEIPLTGQDRLAQVHPRGGVIIDFSLAPALPGLLAGAAATDAALVIGTTGHDASQRDAIAAYARRRPVVLAANFSVGIPAIQLVLELLARILPPEFQAEQVETHHLRKVDRPSGTARQLVAAWSAVRGGGEVPVHSLRLGGITGEHAWTIADDEETLVVTHRAHSRRAFLRGVVPAVRFAAVRGPGLYGMRDVLEAGV
jgi:4-hydroxy-tetrahydrodipicolinate reductase